MIGTWGVQLDCYQGKVVQVHPANVVGTKRVFEQLRANPVTYFVLVDQPDLLIWTNITGTVIQAYIHKSLLR